VTLLFTDVEDSDRLWEADREAMAEASARHHRIVREQIEAAGGHVFKTVGEAFRVVFADPAAALVSAVAIQRAVGAGPSPPGAPIRVRVALHSGACVERDGDYFGPVVNRTARLLAAGHGGQVLVSGATCELLAARLPRGIGLEDLGEHQMKDLGRAERVFQVTGPGLAGGFGPLPSLDDPALRHNLPSQATSFVGRVGELAQLRSLISGGSRLVTITGPGGIGKSRLALQRVPDEHRRLVGEAAVVVVDHAIHRPASRAASAAGPEAGTPTTSSTCGCSGPNSPHVVGDPHRAAAVTPVGAAFASRCARCSASIASTRTARMSSSVRSSLISCSRTWYRSRTISSITSTAACPPLIASALRSPSGGIVLQCGAGGFA
jgi:class 3 adenylate cyclase